MPDPNPPVIVWPQPATPCDEGTIYTPILVCNGMGEWIPDYIPSDEEGGLVAERTAGGARIAPSARRRGCGGGSESILRAVELGAAIYQRGFDAGRTSLRESE